VERRGIAFLGRPGAQGEAFARKGGFSDSQAPSSPPHLRGVYRQSWASSSTAVTVASLLVLTALADLTPSAGVLLREGLDAFQAPFVTSSSDELCLCSVKAGNRNKTLLERDHREWKKKKNAGLAIPLRPLCPHA
jgi:hypothetical protein